MKAGRGRQRGHLLIEFAVAAAVATAAVSATIATVISTAKSGREIEVLTQAVSDAQAFAAYSSNLHQMGGPNSGYGGLNGDLANDYVHWINQNYPILPNGLVTVQSFTNPLTTGVSNGTLEVGNLGTAYGYQLTPTPGTYVWSAADNGANTMQCTLTYAHAQAFVGIGTAQLAAPPGSTGTAGGANPSAGAEAVLVFLGEDPGTGIVTVAPTYNFGTITVPATGNIAAGLDLSTLFTQTTAGNPAGPDTAGSATLPNGAF